MNCIAWNARGLGSPRAFQELRRLLADFSPALVFICETKVRSGNYSWWRSFLGYTGMFVVDAKGKSGGLILLWKEPAHVFDLTHLDILIVGC